MTAALAAGLLALAAPALALPSYPKCRDIPGIHARLIQGDAQALDDLLDCTEDAETAAEKRALAALSTWLKDPRTLKTFGAQELRERMLPKVRAGMGGTAMTLYRQVEALRREATELRDRLDPEHQKRVDGQRMEREAARASAGGELAEQIRLVSLLLGALLLGALAIWLQSPDLTFSLLSGGTADLAQTAAGDWGLRLIPAASLAATAAALAVVEPYTVSPGGLHVRFPIVLVLFLVFNKPFVFLELAGIGLGFYALLAAALRRRLGASAPPPLPGLVAFGLLGCGGILAFDFMWSKARTAWVEEQGRAMEDLIERLGRVLGSALTLAVMLAEGCGLREALKRVQKKVRGTELPAGKPFMKASFVVFGIGLFALLGLFFAAVSADYLTGTSSDFADYDRLLPGYFWRLFYVGAAAAFLGMGLGLGIVLSAACGYAVDWYGPAKGRPRG